MKPFRPKNKLLLVQAQSCKIYIWSIKLPETDNKRIAWCLKQRSGGRSGCMSRSQI
ncbi:hypothetical protein Plhal304r1_c008g0031771 [Plasmopara halstedii]